jgi:hypothetical protein
MRTGDRQLSDYSLNKGKRFPFSRFKCGPACLREFKLSFRYVSNVSIFYFRLLINLVNWRFTNPIY